MALRTIEQLYRRDTNVDVDDAGVDVDDSQSKVDDDGEVASRRKR
jgi:hypothetical protein